MTVYWSFRARQRLRDIHEYIAQDSPQRALQWVDRLTRRADRLALEPRADHRVREYGRDEIREVLERPYRLIYRVSGQRIDILTVKHYRQRLPKSPAAL